MNIGRRRDLGAFMIAMCMALGPTTGAWASIVEFTDREDFQDATGAESITGPIPNLGSVGLSADLGDVTIESLSSTLFFGTAGFSGPLGTEGWSTLIPGNDIALSDEESFRIRVNLAGPVSAFGLIVHEPTNPAPSTPDACNFPCTDSTFSLTLFLGGEIVDSTTFNPEDDKLAFFGVASDAVFDQVELVEQFAPSFFDNEYFGEFFAAPIAAAVPEPETLVLLGVGLIGLGLSRRRHA